MSRSFLACMPLIHALLYALGVLGVCTLRRPILGAMSALVMFFVLSSIVGSIPGVAELEPITVYNHLFDAETRASPGLGVFDLSAHHYPLVYGTIAAVFLTASFLAFWMTRKPEAAFGRGD
jgi:hypothetical protein